MFTLYLYPSALKAEEACAKLIAEQVKKKPNSVLGLATGETMIGVYEYLCKWEQEGKVDFSQTVTFNLDEYLGLAPNHPDSFYAYMQRHFFSRLRHKPKASYILNGIAPDPEKECERFEEEIKKHGGIDLQLLGLGRNAHIGFNEPGSDFSSRTRVVNLTEDTRKANLKDLIELKEVPEKALTMGIKTILEARFLLLLATGENKAKALFKSLTGPVSIKIPGSALLLHPRVVVIADLEAGKLLKENLPVVYKRS